MGEEPEEALVVALSGDGVEEDVANGFVGLGGQVGSDGLLQREPARRTHQLVLHRTKMMENASVSTDRNLETVKVLTTYQHGAKKSAEFWVGIGGHRHGEVLFRSGIEYPSHDERFSEDIKKRISQSPSIATTLLTINAKGW